MKQRILFFNGTLGAGGAEKVMSLLVNQLSANGEQVEVVLYHADPIFCRLNDNIKVTFIAKENKGKGYLYNLLWLRKYISENADVVVSFNASMNIFAILATLGLRIRVIVADRNDPRKIPKKRYMRFVRNVLYHFADGVVVQNRGNQKYFDQTIQRKSVIIYNPVDMGHYKGRALVMTKRKRIVSIGRTTPQKNQKLLIDAFANLKKDYPDYTLSIYGEGPLRSYLKQYAVGLGIGSDVELPGAVKDVHDRILDAEIFVLCSNYEGMPNALLEAMVLGLPVISSEVSGAKDLIVHKHNGLLFNAGDTIGLEKAMRMLIEDVELRDNCARNATSIADALKSDSIAMQWKNFIESLYGDNVV